MDLGTRLSIALLCAVIAAYEIAAPYVKVEESFNMQAAHDLLHVRELSQFDHHVFPGVVPRTFLGALAISGVALPITNMLAYLGIGGPTAMLDSHVVRLVLGAAFVASVQFLGSAFRADGKAASAPASPTLPPPSSPLPSGQRRRVRRADGTQFWLNVLIASQFHLCYYSTRTLPNTFALVLVTFAAGWLFRGRPYRALAVLGFTAAVFRSDVLVLVAPLALVLLQQRDIHFFAGALVGIASVIAGIVITAPIDSFFWRRLLWPEGVVLYFNTAENKSHEWGTQPWHWYFSAALPKALTALYPLVFYAAWTQTRRVRAVFVAAVAFVALYSLLPHKELRFVLIAFPLLLLPAARWAPLPAAGLSRRAALFCVAVAVLVGFAASAVALRASVLNYPGAAALEAVHALSPRGRRISVHLDAFACMNGITRFNKERPSADGTTFVYDKRPELFNQTAGVYTTPATAAFDFVITRIDDVAWHEKHGFYTSVAVIDTFDGFKISNKLFWPLRFNTKPFLAVLRRKDKLSS